MSLIAHRVIRQAVPAGVEECWAQVQGARMRYLKCGRGPALLLVHGLMGYSFSWSENMVQLGKHYTVYAPDLFNTGLSDRVEQDGTLEVAARSLLAFMDAAGIDDTHIVGSSHGGTVVMLAATLAPGRFQKVVAVSPANEVSERRRWQATVFSAWWGRWAGYCVPYLAPLIHGYFLARMYADASRVLPGTVAGYNAPLKVKGTVRYLLAVMKCWQSEFHGLHGRLSALRETRLTFLWGEADKVVRMNCREDLLRDFPRASFVVISDAGHLPYEERPELFNQTLLQCLQEQ